MAFPVVLPRPPLRGENLLAFARAVCDYLRAITPHSSPHLRAIVRREGTTFDVDFAPGGGAAGEAAPFDVSIATPKDGSPKASFVPGTGNNLVPDNVLDEISFPEGAVSYAFLRLTTDGRKVQSCTLMFSASAPDAPDPVMNALPTQVDVALHIIDYTEPTGTQKVGTYTPYRVFFPATDVRLTAVEVFRTSVDHAEPGKLPYDIWYTWEIGAT